MMDGSVKAQVNARMLHALTSPPTDAKISGIEVINKQWPKLIGSL